MAPTAAADAATQVVDVARTALGKPYAWGAAGPDAFDCSGLIFWAYAQIGITVPRTSQQQAIGGQPVDRNDLQPGDVVTFYPDASHAALYTGGGNVIQASTYGRPVQEVPLEQAGPFHNARRYLTRETMTLFGVDLSNNNWGGAPPASIVPTLNEIIAEGFRGSNTNAPKATTTRTLLAHRVAVGAADRQHRRRLPLRHHRRPGPAGAEIPLERPE
ncbi:C40 family peptidase [Mycobacterium branderi]